ncbi:dihydrolipoyl dehydrogenase family protein [Streptomyces albidus (ex Kaewkla and Franco 2022)]|uniref:dihydrolipoyl dehydrogenase family protein n=1 Tax=Streptomyces albidus (ex Kaewkla and Franco 2022) TaxID=722709 RepID=UPI0015EF9CAE|nr:NAD(P)/FAD-dependent oxidoreductase [Streptomyces albidus (ex Kaewkla and Franco 2022)]
MTRSEGAPGTAVDDEYDLIVIGAGPVGENVAERGHAAGLSALIIESELVGGDCSYWACMPSKALLRPVAALADARRVAGAAQAVTSRLDAAAVLARRDGFTSNWDDKGQVDWLLSVGVELQRGHGRLDGPRRVTVDIPDGGTRTFTARHAVAIATGSRAALPSIQGIETARPWTSREATSAKEVPGRLAVVGGGVVAVEMATVWQALGTQVTMLVRGEKLMPRMEPFAGELVVEALRAAGTEVRTGVEVEKLERPSPGGPVTLSLSGGGQLESDEVLFATGRLPRTDDLGLETVGCRPGGFLTVDDSCRVEGVKGGWLYAVGDANGRALLTHQGKYQARVAGSAIGARAAGVPLLETDRWGAHAATADHDAVPQVVFTDPEVASVGLTAAEAENRGLRVRVVDLDMSGVAGASLYADDYRGHARMVVDLDREVVVGVTFVGAGIGELLHSASVAVAGEIPMERLWHAVPSYPTMSEVWLRLLETYRG